MTPHVHISSFKCLPVGQQTWYAEKSYWHQKILSEVQRIKFSALSTHRPLVPELNNLTGLEVMLQWMSVCSVESKKSRFVVGDMNNKE